MRQGSANHAYPADEETEAQRGQRAFLRPHSQSVAEPGITTRPAPPLFLLPHLALPSELAAWFSLINNLCSRELNSSCYTDPLPSSLSQDLEGPRFPCKATWRVLNTPSWLRRCSSTSHPQQMCWDV